MLIAPVLIKTTVSTKWFVVSGIPVVYPSNTTLTVQTGQRVVLAVEFCANPPATRAFWITETSMILPGDTTPDGKIAHKITVSNNYCHIHFCKDLI